MKLTIDKLKEEAIKFCKHESNITHDDLVGVTDGKAVGTYIEHKFEKYLKSKYEITIGSSAKGIDLPDSHINTDIKVTSTKKPQSSTPFKNIEQKVYGLGYNLLILIYEKTDANNTCYLNFKHTLFIEAEKTGDYNLTKILREMIENNANETDIIEVLKNRNVPGNQKLLEPLSKKIISNPPKQGYLTITNVFQWRLRYNNAINLEDKPEGIYSYEKCSDKELGNYQTPLFFTDQICEYLKNTLKINPDIIIEPTCGIGNFLKSASKIFPKKQLYGIEIDHNKLNEIDKTLPNLKLINNDIFKIKFDNFDKKNSFLIIGNPPQTSNIDIAKINTRGFNKKLINLKKGDINTKDSKLTIPQRIILKIIFEFKNTPTTIAFLCKKIESRNIFIELKKNNIKYTFVKQINITSGKIDKINEDMCLFVAQFGEKTTTNKICEVSNISDPTKVLYKFGFIGDNFYLNIDDTPKIDGECKMKWKSGVKHDCANVLELNCENKQLKTKNNTPVFIEKTLTYPLLKGSQLNKPIINKTSKYIIITQEKIRQDTSYIKTKAPKTWQYLNNNKKYFDKRKSAIYKNTPDFSIFGIGDYTFKKYKVAISGFNKNPIFSLIHGEKPVILDDTSYFLSFEDYDDAYITMLILNSQLVKKFLKNIAFLDSKRPFSKKVLKRIDISKCLKILKLEDLKKTEEELGLEKYITNGQFIEYKKKYATK